MSFTSGLGINAYGVRMVYQSSDMVTATSSSSSPTVTGTTSSSSSAATGGGNTSGSGSSTSTGTIIAVAVVVPVVVLAMLAGLFFWWRKRRAGYNAPSAQAELAAADPSVSKFPEDFMSSSGYFASCNVFFDYLEGFETIKIGIGIRGESISL
jgi:hypothetical protein